MLEISDLQAEMCFWNTSHISILSILGEVNLK